jgi:hypothetical protein
MIFLCRWHHFCGLLITTTLVLLAAASPSFAYYTIRLISLDTENPDRTAFGKLTWQGGFEITGDDKRFGGLSALQVSTDGKRLIAVTDRGHWLTATLAYREGQLSGASNFQITPLLDLNGQPLSGRRADAESLAVDNDGLFVSFERNHRIWRYAKDAYRNGSKPTAVAAPDGLRTLQKNGGIEAMTRLCDGRLLAVAEKSVTHPNSVDAWIQSETGWQTLAYRTTDGLSPTGATTLPNCDVLFVERSFSVIAGLDICITRLPSSAFDASSALNPEVLANLSDPLTIDNFEGISARRDASGNTLIYIVSDDNFSATQRTLLMMFALKE